MSDSTPLRAVGVSRTFTTRAGEVRACVDVNLQVEHGELLVLRGPSGAGKTTLLNLLGGLDQPTSGQVYVDGADLTAMSEAELVRIRRRRLGYVFQSFGLLPVLSAAENIEVPLRILGVDPAERTTRVAEMLERVGLGEHAHQRPYELSGGQQQRVGLARALVTAPAILIADEPTGQLDSSTAAAMMELIHELVRAGDIAAIVSTHDPLLMARADRVIALHDGSVEPAVYSSRHAAPE